MVADGKYVSLTESQHPYMYLPWSQTPRPRMTLHVRTSGDPLPFAPAIRDLVRAASGDLPADRTVTLRYYDTIYTERYMWIPQENKEG